MSSALRGALVHLRWNGLPIPLSSPLGRHVLRASEVFCVSLFHSVEEICFAHTPLLHLQLRIGSRVLHALLDSGASGNFIDGAIARELGLEMLPLAHPSKVHAANDQ